MTDMILAFLGGYCFASVGFLAWLHLRKKMKYGGKLIVEKTPGGKLFSLEVDRDPEEFEKEEEILFKVVPSKDKIAS